LALLLDSRAVNLEVVMPSFGKKSRAKLDTCDTRIIAVMERAIRIVDFTVIYGHRGKEAQNMAFDAGHSKVKFPNSKHNVIPSIAIDIAPWVNGQIPWNKPEYFYHIAGVVMCISKTICIPIRWGGNWDMDDQFVKYDDDESLNDLGHFELHGI